MLTRPDVANPPLPEIVDLSITNATEPHNP